MWPVLKLILDSNLRLVLNGPIGGEGLAVRSVRFLGTRLTGLPIVSYTIRLFILAWNDLFLMGVGLGSQRILPLGVFECGTQEPEQTGPRPDTL